MLNGDTTQAPDTTCHIFESAVAYVRLMISFKGVKDCCEIQTPNEIAHQPPHQPTPNFWESEKALYIAMILET